MLAYSSIAHTGYILVGLAVSRRARRLRRSQAAGLQAVLFYSVAYSFMNLGAFACVAALQRRPGVTSQISTFAGLGRRAPLLAVDDDPVPAVADRHPAARPASGPRRSSSSSALQVGGWLTVLAVLMMLNAAAAAFYYLRVVVYMYMREAPEDARPLVIGSAHPRRAGRLGRRHHRHRPAARGHECHARLDHERRTDPAARRVARWRAT